MKDLSLLEIGERINSHLESAEADPDWNEHDSPYGARFFHAGAYGTAWGKYVYITYIRFQGQSRIDREEAVAYLEWLDAGNRGRHFEQQRGGNA